MLNPLGFSTVTELPGQSATSEQLSMLVTRYNLAARHSKDGDVLEVACGSGTGLGMLASVARSVVGGDIDPNNLAVARSNYRSHPNVSIQDLNAEKLPFNNDSFDVVLLFEAIYYLPNAHTFVQEALRVLRPKGKLLIVTVNCEWAGFNASPFSIEYYSFNQLATLLANAGFAVEGFVGFPDTSQTPVKQAIGLIRQLAVKLHLIPKTMVGKKLLKQLFYGKLKPIPSQVEANIAPVEPLVDVKTISQIQNYKVLYAIASKQ